MQLMESSFMGAKKVILESLHTDIIGLAHEGHQHAEKTLKLLRQACWFPGMRKQVLRFVESCFPCSASQAHTPSIPVEPNLLLDRPWQRLHVDFNFPIEGKYYLHVITDQYSKYPEVDLVTSTSLKKVLKPVLDDVFATHGYPETVTTDSGLHIPVMKWRSMQRRKDDTCYPGRKSHQDPAGTYRILHFSGSYTGSWRDPSKIT